MHPPILAASQPTLITWVFDNWWKTADLDHVTTKRVAEISWCHYNLIGVRVMTSLSNWREDWLMEEFVCKHALFLLNATTFKYKDILTAKVVTAFLVSNEILNISLL